MILKRFINRMNSVFTINIQNNPYINVNTNKKRNLSNKMIHTYEAAIDALNGLQSNVEYLKNTRKLVLTYEEELANTVLKMKSFVARSGVKLNKLEDLSIIHVTGTKGKGSTCAFCESILRHHGYSTGFFSSPHLVEVRERIRINGEPIAKNVFAHHFWEIYNNLQESNKDHSMPFYFQILTILALKVFINEKVDVAIIEVGIGGEFDSTNIISKVPIVGITSLGIDHVSILGNTIEKIAWHKAGIMKKGCQAYTVPQVKEAMEVLWNRQKERNCSLEVVQNITNGFITNNLQMPDIYNLNASLALVLSESWISSCGKNEVTETFSDSKKTQMGLLNTVWPGRFQIFKTNMINYYLDGAHTEDSINICVKWFMGRTSGSKHKKALIFNATGDRNSEIFFKKLQETHYDKVFFVPNVARSIKSADSINFNVPESQQLIKCAKHKNTWIRLHEESSSRKDIQTVIVLPTISDALENLHDGNKYDLLVTGSLHLIGSLLSIIDPDLKGDQNMILEKVHANNIK